MDSEKLIELVRTHVEIFDLTHPKYLDVLHREKLWQEIGQELNQTAANCRSRWNNIRDNYRKYLRKMATKYGQGKGQAKRYKFSEKLNFLKMYIQERETIGNTSCEQLNQIKEEPIEDIDQQQNMEIENSENTQLIESEDSNIEEQESFERISQTTTKKNPRKRPSSSDVPIAKRKVQLKQAESASSALMKYLLEKDREETCPQQSDAVDVFLASIAPTLKKFPPYYLNIAKTKIFSIVQEFELRMIVEAHEQPTTSVSASPSPPSSSQYLYTANAIANSSTDPLDTFTPSYSITYAELQNSAGQQLDPFKLCKEIYKTNH